MMTSKFTRFTIAGLAALTLGACGGIGLKGKRDTNGQRDPNQTRREAESQTSSIWDLFDRGKTENTVSVNKYIWAASLEVLNFLPVQTVDPFTGVIVTGYGTPPNGGQAYRATILIDDPALDARSLNLALHSRRGPVSTATRRAIEDAILSRARQLRIAEGRL